MCYTVTGSIKKIPSYFPDLDSAMCEVSKRLFHEKLSKRASKGLSDIQSLIDSVEEHRI
jgi:hypothetical protein